MCSAETSDTPDYPPNVNFHASLYCLLFSGDLRAWLPPPGQGGVALPQAGGAQAVAAARGGGLLCAETGVREVDGTGVSYKLYAIVLRSSQGAGVCAAETGRGERGTSVAQRHVVRFGSKASGEGAVH